MSIIERLKDAPASGIAAVWAGIKKAPSAAWWLLTKSPKLFRRGFQVATIYFGSLAVEKGLDEAHEEWPENKFIGKADTIIHAAVKAENFLIGGASSIAKSAYDAVPAKAAPMPDSTSAQITPPPTLARTEIDTPKQPVSFEPVTDTVKLDTESLKQAQASMPAALPLVGETAPREAAFMPVEPTDRSRANLNTAIAAQAQPAPAKTVSCAAPVLGPDGLPIDGGYDPKTGITWGPYMKPYTGPRPPIKPDFKP
jgi:hypothetical protein